MSEIQYLHCFFVKETETKCLEIEEKMSDLPLEDVLETAKDPKADDHILEMAVKKIKEAQGLKTEDAAYTHENDADIQSLAKELPMEILLEMVKEPETKNSILEVAVERLEEVIEEAQLETDNVDEGVLENMAELPLDTILDMAKDPEAEIPVLKLAVEMIKEVQEVNDLSESNESLAQALPIEVLLEMAKDPEAKEEILEVAVDRLEKVIEDIPVEKGAADAIEEAEISELPLEMILDMAKTPEATVQVLEMAVEKIKEVQKQNELIDSEPIIESLGKTLPMEMLLEMAKDPEAKDQILELAMERLNELKELNVETEETLVVLDTAYGAPAVEVPRFYYL